jgi:hypothetical protein
MDFLRYYYSFNINSILGSSVYKYLHNHSDVVILIVCTVFDLIYVL